MKRSRIKSVGWLGVLALSVGSAVAAPKPEPAALPAGDGSLQSRYATMMAELKAEIAKAIPAIDEKKKGAYLAACKSGKSEEVIKATDALNLTSFLASDKLDAKLVTYAVLYDATPAGLAAFAGQGQEQERLIEQLLGDTDLMRQMLVADGAKDGQYGPAMKIYTDIQKASPRAASGVLQQLGLAIAVERPKPFDQANPAPQTDTPKTVDPVKRYLHYEKAYLGGELDPSFKDLIAWDLRFLVDGEEPDWEHTWGREMLRNYRPDHLFNSDPRWRYVRAVTTQIEYGSGRTKFDRPELGGYQNILMNGGVCGRRAAFGRFILRCFGIPSIARPSKGHAALAHWTPKGWVICLGPGWGKGFTGITGYPNDRDFLASSQVRQKPEAFLQVKRAQWIGDVFGEPLTGKGRGQRKSGFWSDLSLRVQQKIIVESKAETLAAVGEKFGEADEGPTIAEQIMSAAVTDADKKISYAGDGTISIPAAAYSTKVPRKDVVVMKSFDGGLQIYLERFGRDGCAGPRKLGARLRCIIEAFSRYREGIKDGQATESQAV